MKILTQKEFNEKIEYDNRYFSQIVFRNYAIKDINIDSTCLYFYNVDFINCKIESISINNNLDIPYITPNLVRFIKCAIVNYEKINGIKFSCFENCTFIKSVPLVCPESGEFVGYKKCTIYHAADCVVKLLIPADAKRSSAFGRKCRCSKAKVLGIFDLDGNELDCDTAYSINMPSIRYEIGKEVYPDSFDDNRFIECSNGIHFFMTFEEARDYGF